MPLTFGSLFAGIGGFDLGFERAGMVCKWQVEIDDYANRVLAKHWPTVRRWPDVRTWPQPDTERVDVVCGGFPCQDISVAGTGAGIDGERSGLWGDFARIICRIRPRFVAIENSPALTVRGLVRVLGDLASAGYDAEWETLPACAFGAPHTRDRMFIMADSESSEWRPFGSKRCDLENGDDRLQARWTEGSGRNGVRPETARGEWDREPGVPRVVDGVSNRLDRLRGLGNAVVPQVAEWIGRRIVEAVESAA